MEKLDFKIQTTLRYQSEEQDEPDAHSAIDMYHLSLPFSCTHYIHVIRKLRGKYPCVPCQVCLFIYPELRKQ
jgi:hypothetical protein